MSTTKITAGARLRADLDACLAHAVKEHGPLEFDEMERQSIDKAVMLADRAEQLRGVFAEEMVGEKRSGVLTKLVALPGNLGQVAAPRRAGGRRVPSTQAGSTDCRRARPTTTYS